MPPHEAVFPSIQPLSVPNYPNNRRKASHLTAGRKMKPQSTAHAVCATGFENKSRNGITNELRISLLCRRKNFPKNQVQHVEAFKTKYSPEHSSLVQKLDELIKWLYENPFFAIWYSPMVCVCFLAYETDYHQNSYQNTGNSKVSVISIIAIGSAIFHYETCLHTCRGIWVFTRTTFKFKFDIIDEESQSSFPIGSKQGASSACNRLAKNN